MTSVLHILALALALADSQGIELSNLGVALLWHLCCRGICIILSFEFSILLYTMIVSLTGGAFETKAS